METYTKSALFLFWERGAGSILLRPSPPRLFCYQILFSRSLSLLEEKGGKDWACGHQGPRGVRLARGGGEGQECKELALASDT